VPTANHIADSLDHPLHYPNCLPKPPNIAPTAILDSGTTGHYLLLDAPCTNKQPTARPLQVKLPNGHTIESTHTCELHLPGLLPPVRKAHLFPALAGHSLLSVGQLCDQGCDVTFLHDSVVVEHNNSTLLTGHHNANGLWAFLLRNPTHLAHAVANIPSSANLRELIQYLHASCVDPGL
jgi:hypothetical protein